MLKILCLVIFLIGLLPGKAQNASADSIRILMEEIVKTSNITSCKKFSDYQNRIAQIDLALSTVAIAKLIEADSLYIKANTNTCPLYKLVNQQKNQLNASKELGYPDSISILNAILFAKNKFSKFINVKLNLNADTSKITHPTISLTSFDPCVLPVRTANDSIPFDIYILPEKRYTLTINASGFKAYNMQLILKKDTFLTISLEKISKPTESKNPPVITEPKRSYWWIPAILLALVLMALVWKLILDKKKIGSSGIEDDSVGKLNKELIEKDNLISKYISKIKILQATQQIQRQDPVEEPVSSGKDSGYFITEIMMTAGPRKKMNVDKDLGEDVCGFMMAGDEIFFWLLDGASDYFDPLVNPDTKREYFSSRLLAQSIARKLRSHFTERKMEAFDNTMRTIVNDVKADWLSAVNSLPESERRILKNNLRDGIQPDCATTVLIASLSLKGELNVYRSGDSKMLVYESSGENKVYKDTSLSSKNDKIGPVSFLLGLTPNGEFDIMIRQSKSDIIRMDNIRAIIGFSDGIGKTTEKELIKEYPMNTEGVRSDIIYQLQGTGDDKSLCIIEIKK